MNALLKVLKGHNILILLWLAVALCLLRIIHIGADTPLGVSTNVGVYVDEGYKTFSARNLVLFNSINWHPSDEYSGWFKSSLLTQVPYYFSFRSFGVRKSSARLVTIFYFFIFLCSFVFFMFSTYNVRFMALGLIMLGVQSTFFFFSRVALFEVPITSICYSAIFYLSTIKADKSFFRTMILLVSLGIAVFLIKASSLIYFSPLVIAILITTKININTKSRVIGISTALLFLIILLYFRGFIYNRISSSFLGFIQNIVVYPPVNRAPLTVIGGLICVCQWVVADYKIITKDFYRSTLVGMVILGPVLLAFFPYNPMRYYVPFLPAYLLVIVEWLRCRDKFQFKSYQKNKIVVSIIIIFMFFMLLSCVGEAINRFVLEYIPVLIGDEKGISASSMARFFAPLAFVASLVLYIIRKRVFHPKFIYVSTKVLIGFFLLYNLFYLGDFFISPSYQSVKIQKAIEKQAPANASIAGDWAPFFALNTKLKSLYVNNQFNNQRLAEIRPQYFLNCGTRNSKETLKAIREMQGVHLGQAIFESQYINHNIILYNLEYR